MKLITILYILNSTLLLLHEIESSYEEEWEILKLPGKITGFILLHIPMLLLIFYGILEVDKSSAFGLILCMILGIGGMCPFLVHKVIFRRKGQFNLLISNVVIYSNLVCGAVIFCLSGLSILHRLATG